MSHPHPLQMAGTSLCDLAGCWCTFPLLLFDIICGFYAWMTLAVTTVNNSTTVRRNNWVTRTWKFLPPVFLGWCGPFILSFSEIEQDTGANNSLCREGSSAQEWKRLTEVWVLVKKQLGLWNTGVLTSCFTQWLMARISAVVAMGSLGPHQKRIAVDKENHPVSVSVILFMCVWSQAQLMIVITLAEFFHCS